MCEGSDFGKLQLRTFRKFSEKISAIAYHKGKIAVALASSNQRIEVWNYGSQMRELTINTNGLVSRCLKFDGSIILSMFEEIRSWVLPSGKSTVVFKGGVFRCCSFDYCRELNIVVGSFSDSSIYIWNLSNGEEVNCIVQEHGSVQKVSVYPQLSGEPQKWNIVYLLILKDKEVDIWTVRFDPCDMRQDNVMLEKGNTVNPFGNPFRKTVGYPKIDSFRFKEEFLYYLESSDDVIDNEIVVWDMRTNSLRNTIPVNRCVKNLLAVGNKYIAIETEVPGISEDSLVVIDNICETEVTATQLPSELQSIGADGNPSVIIGETSWLNGLNAENDQDIICLCVCNRQTVHVFKRGESDPDTIKESAQYCNLL